MYFYTYLCFRFRIVTTLDGEPIKEGEIAGKPVEGHNNFQDIEKFLNNNGNRGLQSQIILSGSFNINPWFANIQLVDMTEIPIGHVGVVISFIGDEGVDITGESFGHGNIVENGKKGVWSKPLDPGKYAINTFTQNIEIVPTTNIVLNWADVRNESHRLDNNLSTIKVRSKDGFTFNLDVSQIIHIPSNTASKVIARFGSIQNLVSQVLEPTIGNYFRNSAQDSDVIAFLKERTKRQSAAKDSILKVLTDYNVIAVDTLIGDITPPDELMKPLTDRKVAEELEITYNTQIAAQKTRQELEKQKSIADIQNQIVTAEQGVEIADKIAQQTIKTSEGAARGIEITAEANAKRIKLEADAESEKIFKIGSSEAKIIEEKGKANAEAYKLQADAIGQENFGKLKIVDAIATGKLKLMPDVLISGGAGSSTEGLLAMQLLETINPNSKKA